MDTKITGKLELYCNRIGVKSLDRIKYCNNFIERNRHWISSSSSSVDYPRGMSLKEYEIAPRGPDESHLGDTTNDLDSEIQLETNYNLYPQNRGDNESTNASNAPIKTINRHDMIRLWTNAYIAKFYGVQGKARPPRTSVIDATYNALLSFTYILLVSVTDNFYLTQVFSANYGDARYPVRMLTGAFAATATLVFDIYTAPASQPRNVLLGHVSSAFIGVCVRYLSEVIGTEQWLQAPVSVCLSIFVMDMLESIHPPGCATALIAVIGGDSVKSLGFGYILTVFGGALIAVAFGCVGINLIPNRQYPQYWL